MQKKSLLMLNSQWLKWNTKGLFCTLIPSNRGIKNRNTASQEIAVMDGSQSLSCFHGKSSTLCRVALTDSCARLACLRVSFKERYFLPPPLLSSKHKMIADYMLALSGREINHTSAWRGSFCGGFAEPAAQWGGSVDSKVCRASIYKHSFRCSVLSDQRLCLTQRTQMDHQPPTDGPMVTSDSAESSQPKHKPRSRPNKH